VAKLIVKDKEIECKVVVFDKDGTLVDSRLVLLELAKARWTSVRRNLGEKDVALWEKIVGVHLKSGKIDHGGPLGTAPRREEILVAASAFYLNGRSWPEAKRLAQKAYDEADDSMRPPYGSVLLEGVAEALKRLKNGGLKLAVASTDGHRRIAESLKTLGIGSLFDAIVGVDDVVNGKPSPDMILEVLKRTEAKADEVVMVGDSTADMLLGRNAKVKARVGVLTGFTSRKTLEQVADIVILSVAGLKAG
jgi:phosphoglycolate phosphatase